MSDENPNPNQYPLGEPSVLDYVKSLFRFGDGERLEIPLSRRKLGERQSWLIQLPLSLQPSLFSLPLHFPGVLCLHLVLP